MDAAACRRVAEFARTLQFECQAGARPTRTANQFALRARQTWKPVSRMIVSTSGLAPRLPRDRSARSGAGFSRSSGSRGMMLTGRG